MEWFLAGLVFGALIMLLFCYRRRKEKEVITEKLKESFSALSLEALSKNTEQFLKLANETLKAQTQVGEKELEGKKELIDQTLQVMAGEMEKVQHLVRSLEKDREHKFAELTTQLKYSAEQTARLQETAGQLRTILANTKARGQWGERMAEDVLKLAGLVEGINYQKQKTLESSGSRPDYTFFLPRDRKINMDVKFPFDNYLRYLETENKDAQEECKNRFLKDVRARVREVTGRDYICPEENTVDYAIVFIPNEQVYSFVHENDRTILDEALKSRVILCSPVTLYAVLVVIRQAMDNFSIEQAAAEILSLLGSFNKQWEAFLKSLEKMGKKIDEAQKEFNLLNSIRRVRLERPLRQIEDLRREKGIPVNVLLPESQATAEAAVAEE
ncbi:MAG: DNA recombination protein RmuC [Peptococcaceae bacterium]|nr:MAG: DNA recombination protein RmuC [Peptococcaceae bacterium]